MHIEIQYQSIHATEDNKAFITGNCFVLVNLYILNYTNMQATQTKLQLEYYRIEADNGSL